MPNFVTRTANAFKPGTKESSFKGGNRSKVGEDNDMQYPGVGMTFLPCWNTESCTDGPCADWEILCRENFRDMVGDVRITSRLFHCRVKDLRLVQTALLGPGDLNSIGFVRWSTFDFGSNGDSSSPDDS